MSQSSQPPLPSTVGACAYFHVRKLILEQIPPLAAGPSDGSAGKVQVSQEIPEQQGGGAAPPPADLGLGNIFTMPTVGTGPPAPPSTDLGGLFTMPVVGGGPQQQFIPTGLAPLDPSFGMGGSGGLFTMPVLNAPPPGGMTPPMGGLPGGLPGFGAPLGGLPGFGTPGADLGGLFSMSPTSPSGTAPPGNNPLGSFF